MRLETFFEKFELMAEMPGGIRALRELILEMAVRGLLSARSEVDQNNGAWKEFIGEFDNRIYSYDPGPDPPFDIPDEWRWVSLEELGTTKVRNSLSDPTPVSFVPMSLIPAEYGRTPGFEERAWGEVKKAFTHFADGDVVLAKITPCFENGKSAVMRDLVNGVGAGTTELHVFRRETEVVIPEYMLIYLKSRGFIERGEKRMTGSAGQKRVPRDYFASSHFPLPPPAEQQRIVERVDELMALCDRLEAQQQERETRHAALARAALARFADAPTLANLQLLFHPSYTITPAELRKSILTLAVQGKLVPQDPGDEPASVLLKLISQQRGGLNGKRGTNNDANDEEEAKPLNLPTGWVWSRFPDLGEFGRGKSKHRPRNDPRLFCGGNHRLVQTGDVARANGIIQTHTGFYNEVGLAQSKLWPAGTLCITIAANIADSGILGFDACFPDSIVGFIPAHPIPSACYFEYFMRTAKESIEKFAPATAQKNINLGILEQVWIPVPPAAEQRRIATKVAQLMATVAKLESNLAESRNVASIHFAALASELVY